MGSTDCSRASATSAWWWLLARSKEGRRPSEDEPARCGKPCQAVARGELTAVWVPDERHEAMRDLCAPRQAVKKDLQGKRQQISH